MTKPVLGLNEQQEVEVRDAAKGQLQPSLKQQILSPGPTPRFMQVLGVLR